MPNMVAISILDKEYQVACPPEEQDALLRSSKALDRRMREIRKSGNVVGLERIAVMAALNLCYDLLLAEAKITAADTMNRDLKRLDAKIDQALIGLQQPEL